MKRSLIKAASIANAPVHAALAVLSSGSDSTLYALALIRAAQKALEEAELELKQEANAEFTDLATREPLRKEFSIAGPNGVDVASATRYTPKCTYTYSTTTTALGIELKNAQAREQQSGVAKKVPGKAETLFSLRLP